MRQLYKDRQREGIGFSHNGLKAYERGERPACLCREGDKLVPTAVHHIETGKAPFIKRPLVMFYRRT